ncbi:hypothetical protein [Desulfitobacterium sp. AusDCA]|uniref:hypothetical protein n=1 Tax=Desulfitobacterium sp. AusDCA TaxID=3240383 RepID=UPI003DA6DB75
MSLKKVRVKKALLGFGFVIVLIAGIFTFDDIPALANILHPSVKPIFQINQNGDTYGSLADVNTPGEEPDLVLAKGEDGTEGYLKLKDMWGEQPNNPEEAVAYMKKQEEEKAKGHKYIPLYASDGKTVIGKFKVW